MIKNILLLICTVSLIQKVSFSQDDINNFYNKLYTNDQLLIKKAVENDIYVVSQEYIIKSSGKTRKEFKSKNKNFFGRAFSFGVISGGNLWIDKGVFYPWINDESYKNYETIDTLKPAISQLRLRKVNQTKFINSKYKTPDESELKDTVQKISYYKTDDNIKGFESIKEINDSIVWIVLAYSKDNISVNDSTPVILALYQYKCKFDKNKFTDKILLPEISKNIIGGCFFYTKITTGKIELLFGGMLVKKIKDWYISSMTNKIETKDNIQLEEIKNQDNKRKDKAKGKNK